MAQHVAAVRDVAPVTDTGGAPWFCDPDSDAWHEPFDDAWQAHPELPYVRRLAVAQAAEMAAARPRLVAGDRLVGDWGVNPVVSGRATPFGNGIRLDREQAARRRAAQPTRAAAVDALLASWDAWLAAHRDHFAPTCHAALAYHKVLGAGFDGLRAEVTAAAARPGQDAATADWYAALLTVLDGMTAFVLAHATAADAAGLPAVAARCRRIAGGPPGSFADAVQLAYLLFLLGGHDSPGPLDRYLYPALAADLAAGRTTLDEAQQWVDALWLQFAGKVAYGATLGGQLPDGSDAVNELSWLCLSAIDRLRLLSPRTTLRWHPGIDPAFWRRAVEVIAAGAAYPAVVNDGPVIQAAVARGMRLEHARDYTFVGCGQVYPYGRGHGSYEDLVMNTAWPLELALHNGRDPRSGQQVGPLTGEVGDLADYAAFEAAVRHQMEAHLAEQIAAVNQRRAAAVGHAFDLVRSLLTDSCVARGLDWHAGGADYSEGMVDAVGLATLTDSLLAIRVGVYEQRLVTLPALVAHLDADWADAEPLRQRFRALPKYGNGDPAADAFTAAQADWLHEAIAAHRTVFDGPWGMDIIGWSGALLLGEQTGATPDGRRRGESLADCAGPAQGRNRAGLLSTLQAVAGLPHDRAHGPLALSLRVTRQSVADPAGISALQQTIERYFVAGGQHVQVSVASTADLRAAQQRPDDYRWLVVRVGGFNAYFTELDRRWQDDLIARAELSV
ncbi:MAG: hypothetical protein IT204_04610 [Fimbriimonadaceae bacterium]|nr:hypothetical protein [Fimbriimonadaceae bacterium]